MSEPRDKQPDPGAPLPSPSGSGELVLTEEIAGSAAPTPTSPLKPGFRLSDDALDPTSDTAGLTDEIAAGSDVEDKGEADAATQSGEGEGVALLDAAPGADEGDLAPPGAPLLPGHGPAPGPRQPTIPPGSLRQKLSSSTPSRPLGRLAEFYGQGEVGGPRAERRGNSRAGSSPSRKLGPLCHACGAKLEGARCGRCGEPASVRAQIEVASLPDAAPPAVRMVRSTPKSPMLAAAVRERVARDGELSASAAQLAARRRRRKTRLMIAAWALFQGAIGFGVSTVTTQAPWLLGLLTGLDLALGAWAGRRIASGEGSLAGQVSAGGAMSAGCAVKVLIAAVTSDLSLVLAVAAAVGASVFAAVVGTALGSKLADPSRAQA